MVWVVIVKSYKRAEPCRIGIKIGSGSILVTLNRFHAPFCSPANEGSGSLTSWYYGCLGQVFRLDAAWAVAEFVSKMLGAWVEVWCAPSVSMIHLLGNVGHIGVRQAVWASNFSRHGCADILRLGAVACRDSVLHARWTTKHRAQLVGLV